MGKPFDPKLFTENDWVKHILIAYLQNFGDAGYVNPDQYGIDVLGSRGNYEVEVKHNWVGHDFPYDTIHYSTRKAKFFGRINWFVTFNSTHDRLFLVHSRHIQHAPTILKQTKLTEMEEFYQVSIDKGWFFDIPEWITDDIRPNNLH